MQPVLAFGLCQLHIDHVAGAENLVNLGHGLAAALGPPHAVEWNNADRALLADIATRLTPGLQADAGRLVARVQNDRQPPWRDIDE